MSYRKRILTFFAVCLICLSGFGSVTAAAAQKPEYLKSVTYFGDAWPINFWNSEDTNMEANFQRIAADGFNSIILVVPWREFQPSTMPVNYNQYAFDRLNEVMNCAERHGLWVSLRIGYTWDYYGSSDVPERFANVLVENSADMAAWLDYSKKIYETASAHSNYYGGFITWEDFWDATYYMDRASNMSDRLAAAKSWGYIEYLQSNYTLEEVGAHYGTTFSGFDQVFIPYAKHPSAALFYEFYDRFLMDFLKATQTVFPELSMEVRVDGDVIYDTEGSYSYYSHGKTFSCEGAPYTSLMYSVSMGQANNYEKISAEQALEAMKGHLANIYAIAGAKKLYIEQLLYMDTTAEFSHNAQIEDSQVGQYITSLAPVLKDTTMGYGLWVYRNYVNNGVYNSQFGLGLQGWEIFGDSSAENRNGSSMAKLTSGDEISQKLYSRLNAGDQIYIAFNADSDSGASLTVTVGGSKRTVRVNGKTNFLYSIPWQSNFDIKFASDKGTIYLDDIQVYTYEQNGRIYDVKGNPLDLDSAFRTLNGQLDAQIAAEKAVPETETAGITAQEQN